jgi:uncharacterized protein
VERADELRELLLASGWLTNLLEIVAALDLPDCWIGAGAVRDLVWDTRFGTGFDPANIADVDVVWFDPTDLSAEREDDVERHLREREAALDWDAKNQARVHLWYPARFGGPTRPLTSATDGVATWPETATAIAVRLRADGALDIAAPLALDDLLDGVWRRNVSRDFNRATDEEYAKRVARKQPHVRWPGLVVVP